MKRRELRSGYTTGACAAAAAKSATMLLLDLAKAGEVEIPFPDGGRHKFRINDSGFRIQDKTAWAAVIKDAGDDPDVTNGAEIRAEARFTDMKIMQDAEHDSEAALSIRGGRGVGVITRPGLSLPVGESAINPVPRKMIKDAVMEAVAAYRAQESDRPLFALEITISVPHGEQLAEKTLNSRLGVIGGISILGTTGIVKPLSTEAWTATITSSMDVAKAMGHTEVVLSAGRASEKAHMKRFNLPEESYVMMGDYLEFALLDAKKHGFTKIHLCAQWAKTLKIAMATPQTHVRHGAIDIKKAVGFLDSLNIEVPQEAEFNTAREIFDFICSASTNPKLSFLKICAAAKGYAAKITEGATVIAHLVSYDGEIIADSE